MTRIEIAAGPPTALPMAFLLAAPAWGCVAGLMLISGAEAAVASRWSPATLALVHALTLGLLGNAIVGALLQFLPAAAGVRLRGGVAGGVALWVALNAGAVMLVLGFQRFSPNLLAAGGACAGLALGMLALATLPALASRLGEAVQRGIALAIVALGITGALGVAMVLDLTGVAHGLDPSRWADAHAAWGLLGGGVVLLASVGQVVVPMFQGVPAQAPGRHLAWMVGSMLALLVVTTAIAAGRVDHAALPVAACAAASALSVLLRQARAPLRRALALRLAWTAGALGLLAAAGALASGAPALLVGALALGIALPVPVVAMLMEIVAFLVWIGLQRGPLRRGLPSVPTLLPSRHRLLAVVGLVAAGLLMVAATIWPGLARTAGLSLALAHAGVLLALAGAVRRGRRVGANTCGA